MANDLQSDSISIIKNLIEELSKGNFDIDYEIAEDTQEIRTIISNINVIKDELKNAQLSTQIVDSMFKNSSDMLFITDDKYQITQINKSVEELLEQPNSHFHQIHLSEYLTFDKTTLEDVTEKLSQKTYCHQIDFNLKATESLLIPVVSSVFKIEKQHNEPQKILFVLKDNSHTKRISRLLELKSEELKAFIYAVSHQIKSPIASIQGLAVVGTREKPEDKDKIFDTINKLSGDLQRLMVDLIEFPQNGSLLFKVNKITVRGIAEKQLELLKKKFNDESKTLNITFNMPEDIEFYSDKNGIGRILEQLLDNAVRYQIHQSNIVNVVLSIQKLNTGIMIKVEDEGMGIPLDMKDKIFELFATVTPMVRGTGLGLYIVKNEVSRLGGQVTVENKPEKGTIFNVYLSDMKPYFKLINSDHFNSI